MNEKQIWNFLYSKIGNPYGVAGLMGNLYVESSFNPKNLQGTYERKLGMTDEQYTAAVDNGTYANFVHDSAGYGLAQWTYWSRKEALLNFAKENNSSIGELDMQLNFLWKELQNYKSCLTVLKEASSVKEASDAVVTKYEKPKDQSDKGKQNRANYGQKFYDMFMKGDENMISLSDFMTGVQKNVNRIKSYQLGGDGTNGVCDCIGLPIGALRLAGGKWPGTHGSNWAWRNAIDSGKRINSAAEMFVGEIVFKAYWPGDAKYTLPDAYKNHPDKGDYYHAGIVTSINPLCITHCTGVAGGIKVDTVQGNWKYGGKLKYVDYNTGGNKPMEDEPLYRAIVKADTGSTVRMRSKPSTSANVLAEVPINTNLEVMDVLDGWSQIIYNGQLGYMMSKFLVEVGGQPDEQPSTVTKDQLRKIQIALMDFLEVINKALS